LDFMSLESGEANGRSQARSRRMKRGAVIAAELLRRVDKTAEGGSTQTPEGESPDEVVTRVACARPSNVMTAREALKPWRTLLSSACGIPLALSRTTEPIHQAASILSNGAPVRSAGVSIPPRVLYPLPTPRSQVMASQASSQAPCDVCLA